LIRKRGVADQHYRNEKLIIGLYQRVIMLREAQRFETARFSDRQFWHGGYDKAHLASSSSDEMLTSSGAAMMAEAPRARQFASRSRHQIRCLLAMLPKSKLTTPEPNKSLTGKAAEEAAGLGPMFKQS